MLAAQNPAANRRDTASLDALRSGAGVVVTGQQVGLFGGPLFTPFKAATALARARKPPQPASPMPRIFWLATEDHDFAEINHVTLPLAARAQEAGLSNQRPLLQSPVGGVVLDEID